MTKWYPEEKYIQKNKKEIEEFLLGKQIDCYRKKGPFCRLNELPQELVFIDDFAKIGAFLLDERAVKKQLEQLNSKLILNAQKKNLLVNGSDKKINPSFWKTLVVNNKSIEYLSHQKILRCTLEEELSSFGFTAKFGKALSTLEPIIFRDVLRQGIILKDPSVTPIDGEFNHAIQWLLIAYQQAESSFLSRPVIEIFKELGNEIYTVTYQSMYSFEMNIWDLIVDRPLESPLNDFRSPSAFSKFLNYPECSSVLLKKLIDSRIFKRYESKLHTNSLKCFWASNISGE